MDAEVLFRARLASPEATQAFGEALGRALEPGALVALVGELGSGKTTLVRGLARGLDVEEPVVSPTFTRLRVLPGRLPLHHFDAWRGGAEALFAEGVEFLQGEGVGVVEWADRVPDLPRPRLELTLRHVREGERELEARLVGAVPTGGAAARGQAARLREAAMRAAAGRALEIRGRP
jgi:tRNA threonylcarbamoyladenosine biosynthesis protein TsaE